MKKPSEQLEFNAMNIKQAEEFGRMMGKQAADTQLDSMAPPKKLVAPVLGANPKPTINFDQQNKMWNQANGIAPQFSGPAPKRFANSEDFKNYARGMDVDSGTANYQRVAAQQQALKDQYNSASPEERQVLSQGAQSRRQNQAEDDWSAIQNKGHGLVSTQGDFADAYMAGPLIGAAGRGLYSGANKALEYAIKSPITPDYVKKTFYPGFQAVRDSLSQTGRAYNVSKVPRAAITKNPQAYKLNVTPDGFYESPSPRVLRSIRSHNANPAGLFTGGYFDPYANTATSGAARGTAAGNRTMRHELTHAIQSNNDLTTGLHSHLNSQFSAPNKSQFLRELGAWSGQNRGPLSQIIGGTSFALNPFHALGYGISQYSPKDLLMHSALSAPVAASAIYGLNRWQNNAIERLKDDLYIQGINKKNRESGK